MTKKGKYPCTATPKCKLVTGFHDKPTSCPQYKKSQNNTNSSAAPTLTPMLDRHPHAQREARRIILQDVVDDIRLYLNYNGKGVQALEEQLSNGNLDDVGSSLENIEKVLDNASFRNTDAMLVRMDMEYASDELLEHLPQEDRQKFVRSQIRDSIHTVVDAVDRLDEQEQREGGVVAPLEKLRPKAYELTQYGYAASLTQDDIKEAHKLSRYISQTLLFETDGADESEKGICDKVNRAERKLMRRERDGSSF